MFFRSSQKIQPKDLNNEHFITNITQGNQLNQSGHPCSKVFYKVHWRVVFILHTFILYTFILHTVESEWLHELVLLEKL